MSKTLSILGYTLFIVTVALPLCSTLCFFTGLVFEFTDYQMAAAFTALLALTVSGLSLISKDAVKSKSASVMYVLSAPFSLINLLFYAFISSSPMVCIYLFVCFVCCCFLCIRHGKTTSLKLTAFIVALVLSIPAFNLSLLFLVFGNFGQNTITQTDTSPNGLYVAEVIDSDQGALGGDTLVNVRKNTQLYALVFRVSESPENVYFGNWGEAKNMQMYWKDNSHLVINSVEFLIE